MTRTPLLPCTRRGPASYWPRDARSLVLRRRLRGQAPERLQLRLTTKTPWLGLEAPARTYCGGDFVARLLNDFNGG